VILGTDIWGLRRRQLIEQEPGPRGSPQLPHAGGTREPVAGSLRPTAKAESRFLSEVPSQLGQAGTD
ncbi:uncharacterized protein METZ01_LOCUS90333, partial [marine metagenome]